MCCVRKANCGAVSALPGLIRLGCSERAARRAPFGSHVARDPTKKRPWYDSSRSVPERESDSTGRLVVERRGQKGRTAELARLSSTT